MITPNIDFPPRVRAVFERCAEEGDICIAAMIHGPQTRRAVNAKRRVARELREMGFTLNEIGRFIHRHNSTVLYLLKSGPAPAAFEVPCPDLSGEWAI